MTIIDGHVAHGLGLAKNLTQIEWVKRQLIEHVGIDPYPGTLNLELQGTNNLARWQNWRSMPGYIIEPENIDFCRARCYPVRIEGQIPAAVLIPESTDYPNDKMELVASLSLRQHFSLKENSHVKVERCQPLVADTILFDIDGTLVDSVGAYLEVARVAAEPFGFVVTEEHVRHSLATGKNFWNGVIPQNLRGDDSIVSSMSVYAAREWPRILKEFGTVFEGVVQTLESLHCSGFKLGIVSGARPEVMDLLRTEGILDRFGTVILGNDVSRGKPDPEGICKGLNRLNALPGKAIYVGDTPIDIQASHSAGVRAISVLTGAANSALLSAYGPERLISSLTQLPVIMTLAQTDPAER